MVENQHSINTVLSFGAKSVNPEILEKLLIGREKTADYLLDSVKSIAEHGNNQQILVIGQRGMGKTHLLRVLFHKIQEFINDKKIIVAYFAEEEYGVANYFDFLMRIVNALLKWRTENNHFLKEKIKGLQTFPEKYVDKIRENYLEKVIEDYLDSRPLLILAENFSDILKSINVKEQAKLRSWLYTLNRISIIASSQALSRDFDSEDRPFYGFFNIYYLKNLSFEDSVKFLVALAEVDNRPDIAQFLQSKGQNQVRALHQLVKGNHRLLVTFYSFLKSDTLANLSVNFIKTINDLKPYFETFIRYISPQQQKILRYIALSRKPKQGTEISKNCFIEQKSTSKELSELVRKGLLEAITDPNDKRNKLYDINEPLLRISIEVGEHKEGITALFIDFLAVYYNELELLKRKSSFSDKLMHSDTVHDRMMFSYELSAIEKAMELKKTQYHSLAQEEEKEIVDDFLKNENYEELFNYWCQKKIVNNEEEFYKKILNLLYTQKDFEKAINFLKKIIELNPDSAYAFNFWGIALSELAEIRNDEKLFFESIEKYKKATKINPNHVFAYYNWGNTLFQLGKLKNDIIFYSESIENYKKAIELNPDFTNAYNNWGNALSGLARLKNDEKLNIESIENYKKAIELNPNEVRLFKNLALAYEFHFDFFNKKSNSKELIDHVHIIEKERNREVLNKWLLLILKVSNSLDSDQLTYLESIAKKNSPEIPELAITENYIKIYKRYVLENDKKAIYDLPKEQRIFFEEEILGLKKE